MLETIVTTMMITVTVASSTWILCQMFRKNDVCPSTCHLVWPMEHRIAVKRYLKAAAYKHLFTYTDTDTGEQYMVFENPFDSLSSPTRIAVRGDYKDESFVKTNIGGAA